jgi:uncharacterized protein VirK/YbjX
LSQLVHIAWRIFTNLAMHRKVVQVLRLRPFAAIVESNPKFAFKYLAAKYLVRGLTVTERATCFVHHYTRLYDSIFDRALQQILYWDVEFRTIFETGGRLALSIGASRPFENEGELSLLLKMDGEIFFTLSFTIVPGWVVKSKASEVLLISRLQGMPGYSSERIRLAVKAMHGVHPRVLLLSALEGIAIALRIREIASVSTRNHVDYRKDLDSVFKNSYDDFFTELGLMDCGTGFFTSTVPMADKPLSLIKRGHKIRTRKKRAFRQLIRVACSDDFLKITGRAPGITAFDGENISQEMNACEAEFVSCQMPAVEEAELSDTAVLNLADEEIVRR